MCSYMRVFTVFDLIFVWGVSPKEKEILKFSDLQRSVARQRLMSYKKVNPQHRSVVGMSFL